MTQETVNQVQFELKIKEKIKFDQVLLKSIDEAFSTLPNTNPQAIYNHLEYNFKIKKQDIPCKLEEFAFAIEQTFGSTVSLIEIRIMAGLYKKVKDHVCYLKDNRLVFTEYLVDLQRFFASS